MIDAARLDGAGTVGILRHVVVPVSRPILTTLAVITVVTHWNNFLWPLVITSRPDLAGDRRSRDRRAADPVQRELADRMAATTVAIVPPDRAVPGVPAQRRPLDHDHRVPVRRRLGA
ncbi:ABC transporter permease subunit, partial [Pseudonocardia sp. ICBG601]|uniref:ABC transporter permease subunit n=1 Tax=Pseudonocardia sp. ICBG601 TaxID=2846759 RepID=UPI001CF62A02